MKRILFAMVLMLTASSLAPTQTTDTDKEHTKWIANVMDSIATIKPGMTREDLLKVFTTEGGRSNRLRQTYVYKECPYIKVDVQFEPAVHPNDVLIEMPKDRIVKISLPFLQHTVLN